MRDNSATLKVAGVKGVSVTPYVTGGLPGVRRKSGSVSENASQLALAASVALARLMLLEPATAVIVPPSHEPVNPLGVATTRPVGNVSVNPTPGNGANEFGFPTVKLRAMKPPGITFLGAAKDLLIVGGVAFTCRLI